MAWLSFSTSTPNLTAKSTLRLKSRPSFSHLHVCAFVSALFLHRMPMAEAKTRVSVCAQTDDDSLLVRTEWEHLGADEHGGCGASGY